MSPQRLNSVRQFYKMLRRNGFPKSNIKVFFENGINSSEREFIYCLLFFLFSHFFCSLARTAASFVYIFITIGLTSDLCVIGLAKPFSKKRERKKKAYYTNNGSFPTLTVRPSSVVFPHKSILLTLGGVAVRLLGS
jgi:hypothetical protein